MSNRLRVTMLSKLYPPWLAGLEAHVAELSARIAADHPDIDVRVVTAHERRGAATCEQRDGVVVQRAATLARVVRTPITVGTPRHVRRGRPAVLHFHSPNPWSELVVPTDDPAVPVVVSYYHDVVRQRTLNRLYRPVLERVLRRADRIVVWSEQLVDASPVLGAYRDKIVVSPGGIDTARFAPTDATRARARALRRALAPEGPVVLFVGRLVYYKGVDHLLHAMRDVPGTLVIVGRGAWHERLTALARTLGLEARVRFLTDVGPEALPLHYQAADLLVLPSCEPTETFGLVQVEAHASGIPTICTNLPTGVTTVNLDGVTGLVTPVGDSARLAAAIRRLLDDPDERARMGAAAQRRAVEALDVGRCAREMAALYRELTSRATPRAAPRA